MGGSFSDEGGGEIHGQSTIEVPPACRLQTLGPSTKGREDNHRIERMGLGETRIPLPEGGR
eukprot:3869107-Pyramimonas_sp.AAC.1